MSPAENPEAHPEIVFAMVDNSFDLPSKLIFIKNFLYIFVNIFAYVQNAEALQNN